MCFCSDMVCVCVCVFVRADLEATRSRLLDSEREKSELASLTQQRLEEIGNLKRWACVCFSVNMYVGSLFPLGLGFEECKVFVLKAPQTQECLL